MSNIFKAYDIRGIYGTELTEDIAYKIARSYAQMRQKELQKEKISIVSGRDMRLSSPSLSEAVMRGLVDQGADVIDIGLASTPTFYFAVCELKADGGMIVSASHNPKEYNGIKITRANAVPFGAGTGMEELEDLVRCHPERREAEPRDPLSRVTSRLNIVDEQVKYEEQGIGLSQIIKFKIE